MYSFSGLREVMGTITIFNELGIHVHSVETILFKNRSASSDPYVLDRIRNAEIIFIAGGDQTRYYDYWSGTETGELLKIICKNRTKSCRRHKCRNDDIG